MHKIYGDKKNYVEKEIKIGLDAPENSIILEKTNNEYQENADKKKQIKYNFTSKEMTTYNKLFSDIEKYFIEEEPYKNSNLTVVKVAMHLNTNILYVARAIKINKDMNFNTYMNHYRIDFVKKLFDQGDSRKYTIKYIYCSAGFKQQSTFNIVFKQIEGITPSDYLASKEYDKAG
jgi:YesN/AraC family two-component response regulator